MGLDLGVGALHALVVGEGEWVGPGEPVGHVAVRPPLGEEVLEEVGGCGGGLGGEVGEGGVVLHQYTHHLPELLWGEPRLSLTDKDNVTDGG